jgi:hypothetical protein
VGNLVLVVIFFLSVVCDTPPFRARRRGSSSCVVPTSSPEERTVRRRSDTVRDCRRPQSQRSSDVSLPVPAVPHGGRMDLACVRASSRLPPAMPSGMGRTRSLSASAFSLSEVGERRREVTERRGASKAAMAAAIGGRCWRQSINGRGRSVASTHHASTG